MKGAPVAPRRYTALIALWLFVVLGGSVLLWRYKSTPGPAGFAPAEWPTASRVERSPTLPTMIMFAHPHCPCSRASVGELAVVMSRASGGLVSHVLFNRPSSETEDWTDTDLWRSASAIPGVKVSVDVDGEEAHRFGASTSGHAVLYDARGRLVFAGGITNARGHAGDSEGRRAVLAFLLQGARGRSQAPVFGCSLENPERAERRADKGGGTSW